MMKKISLLTVLLCAVMCLTACVPADIGRYYQNAQLYLGCGDYKHAAELFSQLGEYEDAADYALYAAALQALADKNYDLARANFESVAPFKSSSRYLMYLDARTAEDDGNLTEALSLYEKLGTFADAHRAVERLKKEIPEAAIKEGRALMAKGDYEAARALFLSLNGYGASETLAENCTTAMNKAAYNAAEELAESGDLLGAMESFTALGEALGAAKRASECLAAIQADLDARYAAVTLATAPELIEAYEMLGENEMALARIDALKNRFGSNLELIAMDAPYVCLGMYPQAEDGEEQAILWRGIKQEGAALTLLADCVLDAAEIVGPIPLTFAEAEKSAVGDVQLPSMADLAQLQVRTCTATPYALAQGAATEDGAAFYWLRDGLENGLHPVIGASGALNLPEEGVIPGVRPMVTLDLEQFTFTTGSGTAEDPFRAE